MNTLLMLFNFIQPFLIKKIPLFSQTVGQFSKSKSNNVAVIVLLFGINIATADITSVIGHFYILAGITIFVLKDAIVKIKK